MDCYCLEEERREGGGEEPKEMRGLHPGRMRGEGDRGEADPMSLRSCRRTFSPSPRALGAGPFHSDMHVSIYCIIYDQLLHSEADAAGLCKTTDRDIRSVTVGSRLYPSERARLCMLMINWMSKPILSGSAEDVSLGLGFGGKTRVRTWSNGNGRGNQGNGWTDD